MRSLRSCVLAASLVTVLILNGCAGKDFPIVSSGYRPAQTIYVIQNSSNSTTTSDLILGYSAAGTGSLTPTSSLTLPAGYTASDIAVDSSGVIYVSAQSSTVAGTNATVFVYAAGATGTATPTRTITGATTTLTQPVSLAVNPSGLIYVADSTRILVFASGATGNVAPTRTITPGTGGFTAGLQGIAVDGTTLYVLDNSPKITAYASSATGPTNPLRTLSGANTLLTNAVDLSLDNASDIYVNGSNAGTPLLLLFPSSAAGNAAPQKSFGGTAVTGVTQFGGAAGDNFGNGYVLTASGSTLGFIVVGPQQAGNVAPLRTAATPAFTNSNTGHMAIY